MALRETLQLDLAPALGSVGQLDARLSAAAKSFEAQLAAAVQGATAGASVEVGGASAAQAELAGLSTQSQKTETDLENLHKKSETSSESLKKVGNTALIAGGLLAAGIGIAIARAADFEHEMSTVQAVTDANAKTMGRLREAAIQAGQATIFSAKESAQAETELAKAGVSTKDILGGALVGALNLAAAGQLDLAQAATITAQALNIFNLSGDQTNHVADVLAAGANKSATDVASLGDSLATVGPVTKTLGISLEDTVGTLSYFSQVGLDASTGAYALRTALLQLTNATGPQSDAMKQLGENAKAAGVKIADTSKPFFDAKGNFIGLAGAADVLRAGLGNATQEQRQQTLAVLGGQRGVLALTALYNAGGVEIKNWSKAVNDSGAAQRFASKQLDNLSGDLEQLRGSLETVLIQQGSKATAALRFLAQAATGTLNAVSDLPGPVAAVGGGLFTLSAGGLLAIGAVTRLTEKFKDWQAAAAGVNPALGSAVTGLGKLAGATAIALPSIQAVQSDSVGAGVGIVGLAASGALLGSAFTPVGTAAGALAGTIAGLTLNLTSGGESVDAYRSRIAALGDELNQLTAKKAATKFVEALGETDKLDLAKGKIRAISNEIEALAAANPAAARKVVDGLDAMIVGVGKFRGSFLTPRQIQAVDDALERGTVKYQEHSRRAKEAADENQKLRGNLSGVAGAADSAAGSTNSLSQAFADADQAATDYKTALDHLLGIGLDVESQNIKYHQSIDDVTKSLLNNGNTLDINTEQGQKNRQALLDSTEAALGLAEAQQKQDGDTNRANQTIGQQVDYLSSVLHQMGLNDEQTLTYIEDLLNIPPDQRTNIHNDADLKQVLVDNYHTAITNVPTFWPTTFGTNADDIANHVRDLTNTLLNVPREIPLHFGIGYSEGGPAVEHGAVGFGARGLVGLAHGGAGMIVGPHQPVLIGEGLSREAVVPFTNFGDMVATIKNTGAASQFLAASLAAGGSTGTLGGGPVNINVNVTGYADPYAAGRAAGRGIQDALAERRLAVQVRYG